MVEPLSLTLRVLIVKKADVPKFWNFIVHALHDIILLMFILMRFWYLRDNIFFSV